MPILDDCAQPTKPTNPHIVHTYNHQPSNQPFKHGYACVVCNSPHRFVLLLCKSIWALVFLRQGIVVLLSALAQTHTLRPVLCPGKPGRFYPDFIPYHCQYWCLSGGSCGSSHGVVAVTALRPKYVHMFFVAVCGDVYLDMPACTQSSSQ